MPKACSKGRAEFGVRWNYLLGLALVWPIVNDLLIRAAAIPAYFIGAYFLYVIYGYPIILNVDTRTQLWSIDRARKIGILHIIANVLCVPRINPLRKCMCCHFLLESGCFFL